MREGPDIARIASLVGDPARANMLTALMGGQALTATELAGAAGITLSTASSHLAKLEAGGLVGQRKQGRHRYFTLADDEVGLLLEGLMGFAAHRGYLRARPGPKDPALRKARVCYNHAVTRDLTQGGRVVLEMEVGKGEVMTARLRSSTLLHDDPALVSCLTEAAWALDVPAGKMDDNIYVVRYPLVLTPPKSDQKTGNVERNKDEVLQILLGEDARKADKG